MVTQHELRGRGELLNPRELGCPSQILAPTPSFMLSWLHPGLTWTVSVPFSLVSDVVPPPNRLEMVLPSSRGKKAQRLKGYHSSDSIS